MSDDLEKLLAEVCKTISDNRQFLDKFVEESFEVDSDENFEDVASEDELEEL